MRQGLKAQKLAPTKSQIAESVDAMLCPTGTRNRFSAVPLSFRWVKCTSDLSAEGKVDVGKCLNRQVDRVMVRQVDVSSASLATPSSIHTLPAVIAARMHLGRELNDQSR